MVLELWTDGCSNNNGSGWAVICPERKEIWRGDLTDAQGQKTTNQKAELAAVIQSINIYGQDIRVHTDSMYVIGCFKDWCSNWLRNGWKTSKGKPVENRPLIELGLKLGAGQISYIHVRGHAGDLYNDMADYYCKNNILRGDHRGSGWILK